MMNKRRLSAKNFILFFVLQSCSVAALASERECKAFFEQKQFKHAVSACRSESVDGSASAKYYLGELYMKGLGVTQNGRLALRLIKESAQLDYKPALIKMAGFHRGGRGVEKSDVKACDWWERLAESNDADGQEKLGVCFLMGKGRAKDMKLGYAYLTAAANNGNDVANYILETYADKFPTSLKEDAAKIAQTLSN